MAEKDLRKISLERADQLKARIKDYLEVKEEIKTGFDEKEKIQARQKKIKEFFKASQKDWGDWHWQLRNRVSDTKILAQLLELSQGQEEIIERIGSSYRWGISPYYLSLIDPEKGMEDPVYLQSIPTAAEEVIESGEADPMLERETNPAACITRRYPDRLIIYATNQCGMYCRHCQRRRNIGEIDTPSSEESLREAFAYVRANPEIRDVLVTGGDSLTLGDDKIEWILQELRSIPHVEIIRLGSRMIVTVPQRITEDFCQMIKKYHPLYVNTHFNSPAEITEESKKACEMLANVGVPLGNQAVLLKNINDNPYVMKKLNQELLKIRVRPYYIFHAKAVAGTEHFRTSVDKGIEIIRHLRGYTSGLAIPTFIVNAPGGKGKTPMAPAYMAGKDDDEIILKTWEGLEIAYPNKD
jgi:glutamate 2,3-aminomutase